jgi:hypothetical protein
MFKPKLAAAGYLFPSEKSPKLGSKMSMISSIYEAIESIRMVVSSDTPLICGAS